MTAIKSTVGAIILSFLALFSLAYPRHQAGHTAEEQAHVHDGEKFHVETGTVSRFHAWLDDIANAVVERYIPLKDALEGKWSLFFQLLFIFLAGLLVGLTPCIYPMIPITLGVMQGQASRSVFYNFLLSLCYVLGIATVFSALGYLAATTTIVFGQWLSSPLVVLLILAFFLYFSFALFGFYELYIPRFLRRSKTIETQGSLLYTYVAGVLSGAVASTCSTPALLVMLGYVAKIGNPFLGFLLLFTYTFGFCFLLLILGTFSGLIAHLPKAGAWMLETKKLLAFMMLAVSIYILEPLVAPYLGTVMYGGLAGAAALYYLMSGLQTSGVGRAVRVVISIVLFALMLLALRLILP